MIIEQPKGTSPDSGILSIITDTRHLVVDTKKGYIRNINSHQWYCQYQTTEYGLNCDRCVDRDWCHSEHYKGGFCAAAKACKIRIYGNCWKEIVE